MNADAAELAKFGRLAREFWDPDGALRTLHDINPARMGYLAAGCVLRGARVADVGCGGGLLAESLAACGAQVTAIDLAPEMIEVARLHAHSSAAHIDYRCCAVDALARSHPAHFDLVCCMELLEHVAEPAAIVAELARLLRPGGALVLSTINRTPQAFFGAILAAEYLLGLVPRGTHRYAMLRRPAELAAWARAAGLTVLDVSGLRYRPLTRRAHIGGAPDINYLMRCVRAH